MKSTVDLENILSFNVTCVLRMYEVDIVLSCYLHEQNEDSLRTTYCNCLVKLADVSIRCYSHSQGKSEAPPSFTEQLSCVQRIFVLFVTCMYVICMHVYRKNHESVATLIGSFYG